MIVEQALEIRRPPEQVYRFLVDQQSWAALDTALVDIEPRGAIAVGTVGTMTRRVNGLRVTNGWTVTELDEPTRMAMRVTGRGYALTETTTFESTSDGTRVTVVDVLEPTSMAGRLFVAASRRFVRRDLVARIDRLKALLDPPPPTGA